MSKTKELKSSLKKAGKEAKLSTKDAKVTKSVAAPKGKAAAKPAVTKKDEKKSKKKAKEPTPSESSESEEEEDSDSASEDESAKVKPSKANGAASKAKAKAAESESESDNSSESDSSSEEEAPAKKKASVPKTNGVAKKVESESSSAEDSDSSSEDDSDDSDNEAAPKKANGVKAAPKDKDTSSESESSDDEEEAPAKKANGVSNKADADSDASSDDDEEDSEKDSSDDSESDAEEEAPSKKRKAEDSPVPVAKKTKTDSEDGPTSLFVGRLSWNIDDDWLKREFEEFGEVVGSRVVTERDTGRSKGFGYVDFATHASAKAALDAKNQTEIDGREVNVDFAGPKKTDGAGATPRQKNFGDKIGDPTDTLFVGNLSFDATNEVLKEGFEEYGTVTRVSIPTDRETGRIKGFGYVSFETIDQAKAALEACNGQDILGRPARLDYSQPRPDQGSGGFGGGRGGGGFGGRGRGGDRGGRGGRGRGGDRGGRGGRGRGGDRGRGGRGGRGAGTTNRGGFGDFKGQKISFD